MKNLFSSFTFRKGRTSFPVKNRKSNPLILTPGPVALTARVREVLSQPMQHHRSSEFKQTLKQVSSDLKEIFQTGQPVLLLHSTGTGAMEAALSNTLSPGEEVLCICAGKFGERWRDMADSFGLKTHSLNAPWGEALQPEFVKTELEKNKQIRALLISACETSTATEQAVKEISKILKNHPQVLLIVDGITGLGAMDLPMDEWGIDVLVAGSQKSFMIPAGLSFIALSKKAWEAEKSSSCPRYYFDLKKEKKAQAEGQTSFSSSVTLVRALKESLNLIKKEGLKNWTLKCRILKKSTHVFCEHLDLPLYSSNPANSVTAVKIPENLSGEEIKKNLQTHFGIVLAGGQGKLKDKILRIGHLGPITPSDQLRALEALALELKRLNPLFFNDKKRKKALKETRKVLQEWKTLN